MAIGLMENYPKVVFFLLWALFFSVTYLEQTNWQIIGITRKTLLAFQWIAVFVFLYFLLDFLDWFEAYVFASTIAISAILICVLYFHFKNPPEISPSSKLIASVLIVMSFILLFLI